METVVVSEAIDLWEAWIELAGAGEGHVLYVLGDVCTGRSKTVPVLSKKKVQGAAASHLILEVLPCLHSSEERFVEVGYAEPVRNLKPYDQISICAGEKVIARINNIEVVY